MEEPRFPAQHQRGVDHSKLAGKTVVPNRRARRPALVHQMKDAISPIFLHQPLREARHDVTPIVRVPVLQFGDDVRAYRSPLAGIIRYPISDAAALRARHANFEDPCAVAGRWRPPILCRKIEDGMRTAGHD